MRKIKALLCVLLLSLSAFVIADDNIGKVDINTADALTLAEKLTGIGEKKAQAIIDHREKYGLFSTIYALDDVQGIGEKLIEKNEARMYASQPATEKAENPEVTKAPAEETADANDTRTEVKKESTAE